MPEYKIVRSKRRSLSITVSHTNEITVRCPLNYSDRKIAEYVSKKQDWINSALRRNAEILQNNASVLSFNEIYVKGKKLPLIISDRNRITDNAVFVKKISDVKKIFISDLSEPFIRFANEISERIGLRAEGFAVKSYKGRWGCCDRNKKISFNYVLFMLPEYMQRYVVVHELCHTAFFNHSRSFWKLVEKFEPDYRRIRKLMNAYGFLLKLY